MIGFSFLVMISIGYQLLNVSKCWFFYVLFVVKLLKWHNENNTSLGDFEIGKIGLQGQWQGTSEVTGGLTRGSLFLGAHSSSLSLYLRFIAMKKGSQINLLFQNIPRNNNP